MEQRKIFCGPSKILKNILRLISICLKCFMTPTKTLRSISYILNVRSLSMSSDAEEIVTEIKAKTLWDVSSTNNKKDQLVIIQLHWVVGHIAHLLNCSKKLVQFHAIKIELVRWNEDLCIVKISSRHNRYCYWQQYWDKDSCS